MTIFCNTNEWRYVKVNKSLWCIYD